MKMGMAEAMYIHSTEIVPNIHRICLAPSDKFEFNHFLCTDKTTCLIHAGKKSLFPALYAEVKSILGQRKLDKIIFSHVEADETGAMNQWLTAEPSCMAFCNRTANISLDDMILRPATILKHGESLNLGGFDLHMIETPHFPHNWDAHLWFESTHGILFSSDFCAQGGICPAITDQDIHADIIKYYSNNGFMAYGTWTNAALAKLAALDIKLIAPMHGSSLRAAAQDVLQAVSQDLQDKATIAI